MASVDLKLNLSIWTKDVWRKSLAGFPFRPRRISGRLVRDSHREREWYRKREEGGSRNTSVEAPCNVSLSLIFSKPYLVQLMIPLPTTNIQTDICVSSSILLYYYVLNKFTIVIQLAIELLQTIKCKTGKFCFNFKSYWIQFLCHRTVVLKISILTKKWPGSLIGRKVYIHRFLHKIVKFTPK